MLWEYMDLTVLSFLETWSAHIFAGWQRVCWCTNEALNQASPTKEFWENCPQKKGGHIYSKNEGWAYLRKLLCHELTYRIQYSHKLPSVDPWPSLLWFHNHSQVRFEWFCWGTHCTTCIPLWTYLCCTAFHWGEIRFWIYTISKCRLTSLLGDMFRDLFRLLHWPFSLGRPPGHPFLPFHEHCIMPKPRLSAEK